MPPPPPVTREALLQLYKQLLRSCQTYPSKNRAGIYQAIREEWRDHKNQTDETKLNRQITVAYKGLSQLRQFGTLLLLLLLLCKNIAQVLTNETLFLSMEPTHTRRIFWHTQTLKP